LLEAFETDPEDFIASLTQCYLKILKNLLSCSKKDIDKFDKLSEKLFEAAYN
jgi:hypothetical protein